MKRQVIVSELKRLLSMPEVVSGFKSQTDCLAWANEVAALLRPCKEHHAFFMERLNILNTVGLSANLYASTFNIMVSIAKQGLYELEYNTPPDIAPPTHVVPDKKWYEKPLGLILLAVVSGVIVVYVTYYFGWNGPKEEKQPIQEQKQLATPASNKPKKTSSNVPSKKSDTTISQPSFSAANSNIFMGSNAGTVNQTVINYSETKPLPLKDRLISCLDNIDKKIIPALRAGSTSFEGKLLPYQLAELQKLSAEEGAPNYISLTVKPALVFRKSGVAHPVKFKLSRALLQ